MKTTLNPWEQTRQANSEQVNSNNGNIICCSCQSSAINDNKPITGSMAEQIKLSLQNLRILIKNTGYRVGHIARINFYTTSIPSFFDAYGEVFIWLRKNDIAPVSALIQVEAFSYPGLDVEVEATLIR